MKLVQTLIKFTFVCIILFNTSVVQAQNHYEKAWAAVNKAQLEEAIQHFESALKDKSTKDQAQICLILLLSHRNQEEKASKYFADFYENAENPFPELYAIWFSDGVAGQTGKKTAYQYELLKKLEKDEQNIGKLDAATLYRILTHFTMSNDKENADKYFPKIGNIDDWQLLGPFDNVMNSGYDKDFGVLNNPFSDADFSSKYGAKINWFDPPVSSLDNYIFKDMFFYSSNSIIYAQTFVESPAAQEAILKFGYSGSLKVWINDTEIYRDSEHRVTEIDYFRYKVQLNKGYNRILVQLGDFEEYNPNFTLRFTDMNHTPLTLNTKTNYQEYDKKTVQSEKIPYFALEGLINKAKQQPDNLLYQILLAKAYMRSNELDKAKAILNNAYAANGKNYFVLRNLILMHEQAGDNTNQNKFYELFEENYPNDKYIIENKIEEYNEEKNKSKVQELVDLYLKKYPDDFHKLRYKIALATLENDNQTVLESINALYKKYPHKYLAMITQYRIEKNYYSNPQKANEILEKYLETNYNYEVIHELANNYFKEGEAEKTLKVLNKNIELIPYSTESYRTIISLLSRQSKYDEAIELSNKVLEHCPSDYRFINDIGTLYNYKNKKDKAIEYYNKALEYFPFSFETNENIRELQKKTKALELIPEIEPSELIKEYEENFTPTIKKSYDVVSESRSLIIFDSKAKANVHRYIIKLHDEQAIENFQHLNFSSGGSMSLFIDEAKTIKKNGQKIDAERNGAEVVFTNLEVGDYIFVSYNEKQTNGGKSSFFISDNFSLSSYSPYYKIEYNVLVEGDLPIKYELTNQEIKPEITKVEGFTKYTWSRKNPPILKEETYQIPFSDLADRIHVSLDYSWDDIIQWYTDLSSDQAIADFTIKQIVSDLFDGKNLSQEDKAKAIYEFVCKNIQYSYIDFRQSGFIPQKASKVYTTRLGDCKDVSTLYCSMAREAGLKANMVLINTKDNGQKNVILPSLNFNHCIVKVYLDSGNKFLELTDPDLSYGDLYYYHNGAAILEIPSDKTFTNVGLDYLDINSNHTNEIVRHTKVNIQEDYQMKIEKNAIKTGTRAAATVKSFYYSDKELQKDNMKKSVSGGFNSSVTLTDLRFDILEPRRDTAQYFYAYMVENDVLKLGTFRTFKIPFSDYLIKMSIFEDENRVSEFNFSYYENTDNYNETFEINLASNFSFKDIPENVHVEFKGSIYDLKFKKITDQKIEVKRSYIVNRNNIDAKDFKDFKKFMTQVNEGENTHLLFQ